MALLRGPCGRASCQRTDGGPLNNQEGPTRLPDGLGYGKTYVYIDQPGAPGRQIAWNLGCFATAMLVLVVGCILGFRGASSTGTVAPAGNLDPVQAILGGALMLAFPLLAFAMAMSSINQFAEIQVLEQGLLVHIFGFRSTWRLVPWKDIERVVLCPRPYRWSWPPQPVWFIQARGLPFWCRFLGLAWGLEWQPGLVLLPGIYKREELLSLIDAHLDTRRQSLD